MSFSEQLMNVVFSRKLTDMIWGEGGGRKGEWAKGGGGSGRRGEGVGGCGKRGLIIFRKLFTN